MPNFNAAFKKWFGESVVRNKDGTPKVVYHGTDKSIKRFDINKCEFGCHFGDEYQARDRSQKLIACFLSMSNPIRLRDYGRWTPKNLLEQIRALFPYEVMPPQDVREIREWLVSKGFDGVIYKNIYEGAFDESGNDLKPRDSYIVFQPDQIKSATGNDGTWDSDDPDIRSNPEYSGQHTAPMSDSGAPLHDLSGIYPDDIYGPLGFRYYGHWGDSRDFAAISVIHSYHNRPNASIVVYRAAPYEPTITEQVAELENQMRKYLRRDRAPAGSALSGSDWYNDARAKVTRLEELVKSDKPPQRLTINVGDWVTTVRSYAKDHGESALLGKYQILSKKVYARDLFTNGDSIFEFGYDPQPRNQ